ncbi:polysaccharide pyruvyl transferase family protein [Halococcus sp. AFM35]|uniref:polysaccharide pyruvyl transferase family protein n=1 Tax=Halococcus sp. AFM35 TaxID=3421653 RepID=UPI003EBE3A43
MTDSTLVIGYFGFGNAGDDAIGLATVRQLAKRSTPGQITVTTGPEPVFEHDNVRTITYSAVSILRLIAKVDRVVMTGGTHFHTQGDSYDRVKVFSFYILAILWAKLWRTEVDLLAHGIGPIDGRFYRILTTLVVVLADNLSVRDERSLEVVESLPAPSEISPVLAFDVAPLLDQVVRRDDPWPESSSVESSADLTIGVSLTPAYEKYYNDPEKDDEIVTAVADAIHHIAGEHRNIEKVIIFVLHTGKFNDDVSMSRTLLSELDGMSTELRLYQNDPESFIRSMHKVDRVIGMKYHSLVFAFLQAIPTLAVSYHPKCQWFHEYTGYGSDARVSMHNAVSSGIQSEVENLVLGDESYEPSMSFDEAESLARQSFEAISEERLS